MSKQTALAKTAGALPAEVAAEVAALSGAGMETVTGDDLLVPRLTILQKLSPQLDKTSPNYIEGAEEGDICDTGMGRVFDEVEFLPVIFRKQWTQWSGARSSGRMVAAYGTSAILAQTKPNEKGQPVLPNGDRIVETMVFSGFMLGTDAEPAWARSFIAFHGTQLRKGRRWLNNATSEKLDTVSGKVTAPLFWRSYVLGSQVEKNAEGSWAGWSVEKARTLAEVCTARNGDLREALAECKAFAEVVDTGHARLSEPNGEGVSEDEVPF